jgi:hypothetical protein
MANVEVVARLNPGSASLEKAGSSAPALTPVGVAHALGLVRERLGALLLMVKVAQQWRWYPELEAQIGERFMRGYGRPGGEVPAGLLRRMVRLAVFEHCVPQTCPGCKGRGWRPPRRGGRRACWDCGGDGHAPLSDRQRMGEIGVARPEWNSVWSERYDRLRNLLEEAEQRASRELQRVLRSSEAPRR